MLASSPIQLPAPLQRAVAQLQAAARSAAEHTVQSLGLAAMTAQGLQQRDALLGAQYELNRKLAQFAAGFNAALDVEVARQAGMLESTATPDARPCPSPDELVAQWETLSLVGDDEVELHLRADRFARGVAHTCEWEIRELDAYVASLVRNVAGITERANPLRPDVVALAMVRAVEPLSDRADVRQALCTEIGRSLAQRLRGTYASIIAALREAGIQPMGMMLRQAGSRSAATPPAAEAPGSPPSGPGWPRSTGGPPGHSLTPPELSAHPRGSASSVGMGSGPASGGFGATQASTRHDSAPASLLGQVDSAVMSLIRQLAVQPLPTPAPDAGPSPDHRSPRAQAPHGLSPDGLPRAAPNLILQHREALCRAAQGPHDHRVIDVVAGLFDAVLSDGSLPEPIAHALARLQLPVLRAALGDQSFFALRKHPVRRLINRIATLGSAVDDLSSPAGRALLRRMDELVSQVVHGDFDQMALYQHTLDALETFVAAQAHAELRAQGEADRLLARKEGELRVQHQFARAIDDSLRDLPVPEYLRRFISETWSRVIAQAELQAVGDRALADPDGRVAAEAETRPADAADVADARRPAGPPAEAQRETGYDLLMSVQPKGSPALRQAFVRDLPALMKALQRGLDRIQCPEPLRREFFGRLLPAHAESLKGQPLSTLEHNLLARQVQDALALPLPRLADLPPGIGMPDPQALDDTVLASVFSADEASAVGLVAEQAVDWNGRIDIDLNAEPELTAVDIDLGHGLPTPEPPEPTRGASLADHVQIGFAYRMQLEGRWQKVRLTHVSATRSFFIFSHGELGRRVVSMTYRMLQRLCDAGRLQSFENAYLLERAAARARQQLARLVPAAGPPRTR